MSHILSGLRVIDCGTYIAGPAAAVILSDFGAEVIKVERPPAGDPFRMLSRMPGMPVASIDYCWTLDSRNKKSIALDLGDAAGRDVLLKLAATADVFVTNYQPQLVKKFKIGFDELRSVNSKLIYAQVTGYGEIGPEAEKPGYDMTAYWARSGLMDLMHSPILKTLMRRFRIARMARFQRLLQIDENTRILDVGGTPGNWSLLAVRPQVTILNLPRAIEDRGSLTWIFADGCQLPFRDRAFDVVFSNSVIEHLGDARRHQQYAQEIARVGVRYFVQTPNRWFPVEPHLLTPLIHFLPRRWQKPVIEKFTIWEWIARPLPDQRAFYLEHYLRDIQLLDGCAMRRLFPDARLVRERFLGLTKSLIAVR